MKRKYSGSFKDYRVIMSSSTSRVCSICNVDKPYNEYNRSSRSVNGYDTQCRSCQKERAKKNRSTRIQVMKQYYHANKDRISNNKTSSRTNAKIEIIALLGGQCRDCGLVVSDEWPACCFDFHHLNMIDKKFSVARLLDGHMSQDRLDKIKEETKGCVVLCANCHRKHHAAAKRTASS